MLGGKVECVRVQVGVSSQERRKCYGVAGVKNLLLWRT